MRHFLDLSTEVLACSDRLAYQPYPADPARFQETLLRTYEGTQDCPEVNGVRTIEEILHGHRSQGRHDPERWWLASARGRPVGVLMLTELPEWNGWDVSYVGVVPEARGRGVGRELMARALLEARAAEVRQLTLSVDGRNRPAWNLYTRLGFEPFDSREVFLAVWSG
jgi:ribosomal protein S18 acetylase RimI-like enzyme